MKYDTTSDPHHAVLLDDNGYTIAQIHTPHPNAAEVAANIVRLHALATEAVDTVLDFLPNAGKCALQDYGRLNHVLMESGPVLGAFKD